jgi:hypothetical protein
MNFRSFTISCSFVVAIALFLTACTKEGPAGPAGATGPTGPQGPAGSQGPKGDTGVANVIYSNWLDVAFAPDLDQAGDTAGYSAELNVPRLTNTVLSTGEIKVYLNAGTAASPAVLPLPVDVFLLGIVLSPVYEVGKITLIASDDASSFTTAAGQKAWQYRYVLIPGGTPSGRAASIDWNNYNEVKAYLGLKD